RLRSDIQEDAGESLHFEMLTLLERLNKSEWSGKRSQAALPALVKLELTEWFGVKIKMCPVLISSQRETTGTLALSIHEFAVISGDWLTAANLAPIFNGFVKDLNEVRLANDMVPSVRLLLIKKFRQTLPEKEYFLTFICYHEEAMRETIIALQMGHNSDTKYFASIHSASTKYLKKP
ncbi:Serine/threonine-protein phosphatase 4 regulatory subunit 1, partial [Galemys pyrenaicus]